MKNLHHILFGLALLAGVGLLVLSLFPGVFSGFLAISFLALMPLFLVVGTVGALLAAIHCIETIRKERRQAVVILRRCAPTIALLLASMILAVSGLPRRLAFRTAQDEFDSVRNRVASAGTDGELGQRVGIWRVDRCAVDTRGGVFFRVGTGPDGIGPDTMSYGFAYRPNKQGTPFGAAGYRLVHIAADWYEFHVSSDYY
jgi:hypothetical protein